MDKNTLIGFLLIGIVLFAFSWLNKPTPGRTVYHYGTFHQIDLCFDADPCCCRVAYLDGRSFAGMDHSGSHCRRISVWFKDKEKLI